MNERVGSEPDNIVQFQAYRRTVCLNNFLDRFSLVSFQAVYYSILFVNIW